MNIHEEIKNSANVIYQDNDILIVLDIDPISEGHVLILPQDSFKDIDELPTNLLNKIMTAAQTYMSLMAKQYSPKGFSMMQNGGDYNDIDVFHLHVFPRFNHDEFHWKTELNNSIQLNIKHLQDNFNKEIESLSL